MLTTGTQKARSHSQPAAERNAPGTSQTRVELGEIEPHAVALCRYLLVMPCYLSDSFLCSPAGLHSVPVHCATTLLSQSTESDKVAEIQTLCGGGNLLLKSFEPDHSLGRMFNFKQLAKGTCSDQTSKLPLLQPHS